MLSISQTQFNPADILAVDYHHYTHYAIISDQIGPDNMPMLISATKRTGTVKEEIWSNVISNEKLGVHPRPYSISQSTVLINAKRQIGEWAYHLANNNCEHFVNWCTGQGSTSKQVNTGVILGLSAAVLAYGFSNNRRKLKASVALIGGVAVGVQASKGVL